MSQVEIRFIFMVKPASPPPWMMPKLTGKVIVIAMSSVSAVMIGSAIGRGERKRVRSDARSMAAIDVAIGCVLAATLFVLRGPLVSLYDLTPEAGARACSSILGQLLHPLVFAEAQVGGQALENLVGLDHQHDRLHRPPPPEENPPPIPTPK